MEVTDFMIQGRARKWWKTTYAAMMRDLGRFSWTHFRETFVSLYFPPAFRQAKEMELLHLRQGDMSIDAYQGKFLDLISYAPHLSESSAAKYSHFLKGLNQDIYELVSICDDPTSFEGLVNRCKQAETTIAQRKMFQSSRPQSSLGPRAQSFKKMGTSSSSSGFGSVHHFGRKMQGHCDHCGRKHPSDPCHRISGACFLYGEMGHLQRDCPTRGGSGHSSHASVPQRTPTEPIGSSQLRPRAQGQVFALNQDQTQA